MANNRYVEIYQLSRYSVFSFQLVYTSDIDSAGY